ncbi:MAG: type II 3-dehydroquinate dehydratase [Alphaproteobacteria bacterium]|nr:type II 3-dehydroquinate dehydratase [Alphaproteobacteria bacterium]
MRVLVLNGPNLDRLGAREPALYGHATLASVTASLDALAAELGVTLEHFQSAHEGALIERVHRACDEGLAGAVVNAASYTHTSIGLRDAFLATGLPFVEVHLSNVHAREAFRHHSLLADIARGTVVGFGGDSYLLGLRGLVANIGG